MIRDGAERSHPAIRFVAKTRNVLRMSVVVSAFQDVWDAVDEQPPLPCALLALDVFF